MKPFHATAQNLHFDFGALGPFEFAHHIFVLELDAGNKGVVDVDDAVASHDAYFLGGATFDDADDGNGVFLDTKLHADAFKAAQQGVVDGIEFLQRNVLAVWVEFLHHGHDGVLFHFFGVDGVDIFLLDMP